MRKTTLRVGLRILTALVFLLSASIAVYAASYDYTILPNGETAVAISIMGPTTFDITRPADVNDAQVTDATYQVTSSGLRVSVPEGKTGHVEFSSSIYTRKESGVWYFETGVVPQADKIQLNLPPAVRLIKIEPSGQITRTDKLAIVWTNVSSPISTAYIVDNQPVAPPETPTTSAQTTILYAWLAIVSLLIVGYLMYRYRPANAPQYSVSPANPAHATSPPPANHVTTPPASSLPEAKLHVLRAANHNDRVILELLITHHGHLKRNQLERESGLSKSSLAAALTHLEKNNLVTIDRSSQVHFVKLSEWFTALK